MRSASRLLWLLFAVNLFNYIDRQILFAVFPAYQGRPAPVGHPAWAVGLGLHVGVPVGGAGLRSAGGSPVATPADGLGRGDLELGHGALGRGPKLRPAAAGPSPGRASARRATGRWPRPCCRDALPPGQSRSSPGAVFHGHSGGQRARVSAGGCRSSRSVGWRAAFFWWGFPGFWLAWTVGRCRTCPRRRSRVPGRGSAWPRPVADYLRTPRTPSYLLNCLAMTAMTFAVGGLAAWVPTYLVRVRGMALAQANLTFGLLTLVSGIGGTMLGGWLGTAAPPAADRLLPGLRRRAARSASRAAAAVILLGRSDGGPGGDLPGRGLSFS